MYERKQTRRREGKELVIMSCTYVRIETGEKEIEKGRLLAKEKEERECMRIRGHNMVFIMHHGINVNVSTNSEEIKIR